MSGSDYFGFTDEDEHLHEAGPEPNWNESMAFCPVQPDGSSMLIRHGWRRNQGFVEASVVRMNPDGSLDAMFKKAEISPNALADRTRSAAGGLELKLLEPRKRWRARFDGKLRRVASAAAFAENPRQAIRGAPAVDCEMDLEFTDVSPLYGVGPQGAMLGAAATVAARHYESSLKCVGTLRIGDETHALDCYGMRDHSWGPRDLTRLEYSRWFWIKVDAETSAVLWSNRVAGEVSTTGVILRKSGPEVATEVIFQSTYDGGPHHFTKSATATLRSPGGDVSVEIEVVSTLPLYYEADGRRARVIEYGCRTRRGGESWPAWMEYIDNIVDGAPVGNQSA